VKWPWKKQPSKLHELDAPTSTDANATEMARAWIAESRLQVSIRPTMADPFGWGILLVDAARLVADGLEDEGVGVATVATSAMRKGYEAHWTTVAGRPDASWVTVFGVAIGAMPPPSGIAKDPRAGEVLRVWKTGDEQTFVLRPKAVEDPRIWGMLLCDIARSVALACERAGPIKYDEALTRVRAGFEAEWNRPTDTPRNGTQ